MTVSLDPSDPVTLTAALIQCPSITPVDAGALGVLEAVLSDIGFSCQRLTFSAPETADIDNLFATIGDRGPHLAFNGHTDVVPPGDEADWSYPPFSGAIVDDVLYGRGAVDMKSGVAAYIAAAADFIAEKRAVDGSLPFRLSLLITGDEEAIAINGSAKLVKWADEAGYKFDACIVGEPTSLTTLGDTIKVGRRGSLSGAVIVTGKQGHVAYQERADNPLPRLMKIADALLAPLDQGTDVFQPTNLEITSIDTGNKADNVIPVRASFKFNVRFNDTWTGASLQDELDRRMREADPNGHYECTYRLSGEAFRTHDATLVNAVSEGVADITGTLPNPTTGGGTSDARFVKDYCPVVELGLVGTTMHQIDERVPVGELIALKQIYRSVMARFFAG